MALYLVRHGDAKAEEVDPERPLSDRGWAEVGRVARYLATLRLPLGEIRHSGKLRARQTAEQLARHLAPTHGILPARGLGPMDDPVLAREQIEGFPGSLMLVGHLPHLDRLARSLLRVDREILALPTAAALCLVEAGPGWRLEWILTPEIVGDPG